MVHGMTLKFVYGQSYKVKIKTFGTSLVFAHLVTLTLSLLSATFVVCCQSLSGSKLFDSPERIFEKFTRQHQSMKIKERHGKEYIYVNPFLHRLFLDHDISFYLDN